MSAFENSRRIFSNITKRHSPSNKEDRELSKMVWHDRVPFLARSNLFGNFMAEYSKSHYYITYIDLILIPSYLMIVSGTSLITNQQNIP